MCPTGSRHHGQPIRLAGQRRLGSSQRRPVVMGLGVLPRPVLLLFRSAPGNRAVRSVQGVDWHGPVHRRSLRDSRHRRVRVAGLPDANPVETILEGGHHDGSPCWRTPRLSRHRDCPIWFSSHGSIRFRFSPHSRLRQWESHCGRGRQTISAPLPGSGWSLRGHYLSR